MPTYTYTADKDECLSPGGGDHVAIAAGGDATIEGVVSGDFVRYDELFGVALTDYDAEHDEVILDIRGGHRVPVHAYGSASGEAVDIGDWIYWDSDTSELNRDATNGDPVGIALSTLASGSNGDVCVKLEPQPPA